MKTWQAILAALVLFAVSSYLYFKSPEWHLWLYFGLIYAAIAAIPVSLAGAWWSWWRRRRFLLGWRRWLLLSSLVAASCNIVLFGIVGFLRSRHGYGLPNFWKIDNGCGTAGCGLAFWGLLGGEVSRERGLIPIALRVSFCLGILLWIPIGVL